MGQSTTRRGTALPDEAVATGAGGADRGARRASGLSRVRAWGGTEGNEILTSACAALLTILLAAEGITILQLGGLLTPHMFIGLVLIPPVLLKLGSTGYRFFRYYTGDRPYREKGPPLLPLRMLAPVLVLATVVVLASGVALMIAGHRSGQLLLIHKASFILWGLAFAIHFLSYLPRMVRSLTTDWGAARRRHVPGAGIRGALLAASLGAGIALAVSLLSPITGWHREHPRFREEGGVAAPSLVAARR